MSSSLHNPMIDYCHFFTFLVFYLVANDNEIHGASAASFFVNIVNRTQHSQLVARSYGSVQLYITSTIKPNLTELGEMFGSKLLRSQFRDKGGGRYQAAI